MAAAEAQVDGGPLQELIAEFHERGLDAFFNVAPIGAAMAARAELTSSALRAAHGGLEAVAAVTAGKEEEWGMRVMCLRGDLDVIHKRLCQFCELGRCHLRGAVQRLTSTHQVTPSSPGPGPDHAGPPATQQGKGEGAAAQLAAAGHGACGEQPPAALAQPAAALAAASTQAAQRYRPGSPNADLRVLQRLMDTMYQVGSLRGSLGLGLGLATCHKVIMPARPLGAMAAGSRTLR